jgi:replicative DNA helicase
VTQKVANTEPLPPCDLDAERAVLGAILISPAALDQVIDTLTIAEFYRPAHQTIYATALELFAAGDPVDPITISARLAAAGDLVRIGGAPYLQDLAHDVPTARNIGYYAALVARQAVKRRAVETGQRIAQLGHSWAADEDGLTDRIEQLTNGLTTTTQTNDGLIDLDTAVTQAFERLAGPVPPVTPTGLHDLDSILTGGLRKGAVYVIAARPGQGKSLAGAGIGLSVAQDGVGVLVCSLEMSREEITNRILANMSGVELTAINTHQLNDMDWARLRKAQAQFRGSPLLIRDTPYLTSVGLRRLSERLARKPAGLGLIFVDYVQQMTPTDPKAVREQQVAEISRASKRLALQLQVPIILLAQTNRASTQRATPDTTDLRESGSLEADADAVIILKLPTEPERAGELDAHVVKNRHGRTGVVTLAWSPHYARIRSLAPEDWQDRDAS